MAESGTRSLHQIRQETEETRAALTTTVDELRGTVTDRLRPDAIKAEVSGYIRSRGEQLLHDVTEAARRNPMQAIAVGASIAYPVMRMARAIPLPVLMIGAGLFLAGSKTGQDLTKKAAGLAEDLSDEARWRAQQLGQQASEVVTDVSDRAADAFGRAGESITGTAEQLRQSGASAAHAARSRLEESVHGVQGAASETGEAISSQMREMKDAASNVAESSAEATRQAMSRVTDAMRDAPSRATQAGRELFDEARDRLTDTSEKATEALREQVHRNPMLVAGIGLLIGGLIASILPKSEAEQSLMGQASNTIKRRAREAAAAGYDAAKGATGEIVANVAQQASAEGLTPDGVAEGIQDTGHRLQRVAERAVTTAFEPDNQGEDTGGEGQHG
jgi:ElaB/YqjD/DUF883 family membrane-anchored ribosome-binding protein